MVLILLENVPETENNDLINTGLERNGRPIAPGDWKRRWATEKNQYLINK